ncbi:hypothetical protein DID75_01295 [Candidatus Marinamargulisbacteria bacterium SCGC AG-410-N11]|nr:hypothetical protein DID75_01295 [Candidatus Marinamargulisbacteria bacterium SCGC AG-410-N11]
MSVNFGESLSRFLFNQGAAIPNPEINQDGPGLEKSVNGPGLEETPEGPGLGLTMSDKIMINEFRSSGIVV